MFVYFLNSPWNKKMTKKIKVLRMPEKFDTIFSEYLRIFGANNIRGRCTRWAQPTWAREDAQARSGGLWSPCGPSLISSYHLSTYLQKKIHN